MLRIAPSVGEALAAGRPVVALESSVLAQGLPIPANEEALRRMTAAIEARGAVAAVTAVVAGRPALGLGADELARLLARDGVLKVSARDIAWAMTRGADGATTVAGTLALMAHSSVRVFATGGIGGVHREPPYDESPDLMELSRTPVVVVCAGAKSILDLAATLERLESLGVLVVGYRTSEMPGFFYADTGLALTMRLDSPEEVAELLATHRSLGRSQAIVVMQPPPSSHAVFRGAVERALDQSLADARRHGVRGAGVTPYLLAAVERATGGRTLAANLALLEANAALGADIAAASSRLDATLPAGV